jgi:DNA polymerase I-like protein with 3'-5' exonuclease and polymerase domains
VNIIKEIQALGRVRCLDMETAMAPISFRGRKHVRLLQLLSDEGEIWYDLQTFDASDWEQLKVALEDPSVTWVGQNLFFDYRCLLGCGIQLRGPLEDTMIQSALLTNGIPGVSNSLEAIAKRVLGRVLDKTLQKQDWMAAALTSEDLAYAMGDVRVTWEAWQEMRAQIKQASLQKVYALECALIPAVVQMEHSGMLVDQEQALQSIAKLEGEIEASRGEFLDLLESQLQELHGEGLPREPDGSFNLRAKKALKRDGGAPAGFNMNAPGQVLTKLNALGIDPRDPKTGKPSTDKKFLRPMADNPVVFSLLAYKRAEKRRSMVQSWLDKNIEDDGRIHARFAPLSTGTGRFSCSAPNMQQIPRESYIRDCFIAADGYELAVMDVKNMEMAVACSKPIADEALMQQALRDMVDLHTFTAHLIFHIPIEEVNKDQRQRAKSCNFGLLFGSGAPGLRDYFASFGNSITIEEATEFRSAWLKAYPAMAEWHRRAKQAVERQGEVRMVDGRRRWLIGEQARPTVWLNNTVQGTAASIVKQTMVGVLPKLPTGARLIAQIHDELIVEAPIGVGEEALSIMQAELFAAGRLILGDSVDMLGEGSVARSWGQAK